VRRVARIGLTLDCANAAAQAEFWKLALGYEDMPPPAPYATRQEWLAAVAPDDDEGDGAWLHDPAGAGPTLSLLEVPEPKVAKNRLHLDVRVSGDGDPGRRWAQVLAEVGRLVAAGGRELRRDVGHHVVMADPEGNEFCVC
jgi:hypothetical protein